MRMHKSMQQMHVSRAVDSDSKRAQSSQFVIDRRVMQQLDNSTWNSILSDSYLCEHKCRLQRDKRRVNHRLSFSFLSDIKQEIQISSRFRSLYFSSQTERF